MKTFGFRATYSSGDWRVVWFFLLVFLGAGLNLSAYNIVYHEKENHGGSGIIHYMDADYYAGYIYAADVGDFTTFRIDSPTDITPTALSQNGATAYSIGVNEKLVLLGCREAGFYSFDRENSPSNPSFIEQVSGGADFSAEGFAFSGDKVYVAGHQGGIKIFDIQGNKTLDSVGHFTSATDAFTIVINNGLLYIADGVDGLIIADLTSPNAPTVKSKLNLDAQAQDIVLSGTMAYIAIGAHGVTAVDVSDPDNPVRKGTYNTTSLAVHLDANGTRVFVADWDDIEVLDFSNADSPVLVGQKKTTRSAMGLFTIDNYIYVSDWNDVSIYNWEEIVGPDISVSVTNLEFPRTGVGESFVLNLEVFNHGTQTLDISSISASSSQFSLGNASMSIAAGASQTLAVTYNPTSTILSGNNRITFASNDGDESSIQMALYGNRNGLMVGDDAPDFTKPYANLTGSFTLSGEKPKTVMLEFFAPW